MTFTIQYKMCPWRTLVLGKKRKKNLHNVVRVWLILSSAVCNAYGKFQCAAATAALNIDVYRYVNFY